MAVVCSLPPIRNGRAASSSQNIRSFVRWLVRMVSHELQSVLKPYLIPIFTTRRSCESGPWLTNRVRHEPDSVENHVYLTKEAPRDDCAYLRLTCTRVVHPKPKPSSLTAERSCGVYKLLRRALPSTRTALALHNVARRIQALARRRPHYLYLWSQPRSCRSCPRAFPSILGTSRDRFIGASEFRRAARATVLQVCHRSPPSQAFHRTSHSSVATTTTMVLLLHHHHPLLQDQEPQANTLTHLCLRLRRPHPAAPAQDPLGSFGPWRDYLEDIASWTQQAVNTHIPPLASTLTATAIMGTTSLISVLPAEVAAVTIMRPVRMARGGASPGTWGTLGTSPRSRRMGPSSRSLGS
jgi:hypothetical protein